MHVSGDRASENADAVGATNNINAAGTNVCAARSSGNYLLPVGSRSRLRAYTVSQQHSKLWYLQILLHFLVQHLQ